ncbi:hypothetical protein BDB01DRAFT_815379 [Pilobolus umbonatus]|nr:hypothetical protein BDB01DRAFT_815379 [Pilobolus umbonatus]
MSADSSPLTTIIHRSYQSPLDSCLYLLPIKFVLSLTLPSPFRFAHKLIVIPLCPIQQHLA